jgi:diaminohydroxyphosphoribosylaminopyrimidine deaminase/5-amino-6-(5-phosphoribosylamino)uracil reductase
MSSAEYMECALSLAELARGYASPNPAVGAVVVKDGMIVGMGYTQPAGSDHAEVMALRQAGNSARGATMYVSLEPCCHYGRTPPCTQAIINAKIAEVHIALIDPNPAVSGHGVRELAAAGIKTHVGSHQEEAYEVNEAYVKYITTGLPFVITKFAMSLDGKIATKTGQSKWISNREARDFVHALRHTVDAIMVGVNTVIADDPQLTARCCCGKGGKAKTQPLRLIVDSQGRTPLDANVFKQPGRTLLAAVEPLNKDTKNRLAQIGVEVLEVPGAEGKVDLPHLLEVLGASGIVSILVEGGSELLGSLFDRKLVDKVLVFISPMIIGGGQAKTAVGGNGVGMIAEALCLNRIQFSNFGDNILACGYTRTRPLEKQRVYRTG